ncbi:glycosyl hydrolases family 31-domain-containing protein [Echria macrotheca]|uniref:alpha-glucosidase n=1 Tax=Echria macrotheca TaxID=438768 RepID=A0AAJ0FB87_9PEZI|nr:glycosyl hydrolases family 31-domain-containing protein [Echria macrotheca]
MWATSSADFKFSPPRNFLLGPFYASRKHTPRSSACPGYVATDVTQGDSYLTASLTLAGACNLYSKDISNLRLLVEYQTDSRLHVLIEDADYQVYQVQENVFPRPRSQGATVGSSALQFSYTKDPFSFKVTRKKSGEVLFDSSSMPLVFETQYVRLRTLLPQNASLYGLGEHSDSLRLPASGYKRTLWNAESPFIPRNSNLYGSHPIYFDHRGGSGTHGVFLLSASGMDIVIDQEDGQRYLEYNTIGGVLDFYFLAGPNPSDVSKQYAEVAGLPAMMPYWTLGFHQCKYGWPNIDYVAEVAANYSAAGIPLETMWGDIDYMDQHQDFTTDPNQFPLDRVRDFVNTLHHNNQHYIQILDPGIHYQAGYGPFDRGAEQGAFLKAAGGSWYRGRQWAGEVVWPDWFAPGTQQWWTSEIMSFYDPTKGVPADALWVDMDEASNMCGDIHCMGDASTAAAASANANVSGDHFSPLVPPTQSKLRLGLGGRDLFSPGYRIANHVGDLSSGALFTNVTNADGSRQYDTHNLYGHMMAGATATALQSLHPGKRPFVLTRSTFAGTGRHAAHWFGDNASTWDDYRTAITQLLAFAGMHAMPMVGSDVCGFNRETTEHLCARWAMLGAFQPFYRNHADISSPSQEFYRWPLVTDAAKRAIDARYRLLDYFYTALHAASTTGAPVAAPLWFGWPGDDAAAGVQTQWLWGDALLVSPVVDDEATGVDIYLPNDVFYDFWTGDRVRGQGGVVRKENVDWTEIPVHFRGGYIVPMRTRSANTTTDVRNQDFTIVVAPGLDGKATGSLYLDDGVSLDSAKSEIVFSWDGKKFEASGTFGYATDVVVESVRILGDTSTTKTGPWGLRKGFSFNL